MATRHASSGELLHLRPSGVSLGDTQSTTLLRDEQLKVMRLVLRAGKKLPKHAVDGPIAMRCLRGAIDVTVHGSCKTMRAGDLIYLAGKVPHAPRATEDASMLVSIVVQKRTM